MADRPDRGLVWEEGLSRRWLVRTVLGVAAGAAAGFLVAVPVYLLLGPVLESSGGLLRETQGLLWNLVPVLTVIGGGLGWWWTRRRHA